MFRSRKQKIQKPNSQCHVRISYLDCCNRKLQELIPRPLRCKTLASNIKPRLVVKWVKSLQVNVHFPVISVFAWEAYEKGTDVHLQADPTKLELLHREYKVKKEDFKKDLKGGILEKVASCSVVFIN